MLHGGKGGSTMRFGNTGYEYDIVNGLRRSPNDGPMGDGGNRDRFHRHTRKYTQEIVFACGWAVVLLLFVGGMWVPAVLLAAALVWWLWWSGSAAERFLEVDPTTGEAVPVDDRAKLMLGYGAFEQPMLDAENRLLDLIVSARSLPPELCDATCSWECVEMDDAKWVFRIEIGSVNGAVPFFTKNAPEFAAAFGDPDRWDFQKQSEGVWTLTLYQMSGNTGAGVSWS